MYVAAEWRGGERDRECVLPLLISLSYRLAVLHSTLPVTRAILMWWTLSSGQESVSTRPVGYGDCCIIIVTACGVNCHLLSSESHVHSHWQSNTTCHFSYLIPIVDMSGTVPDRSCLHTYSYIMLCNRTCNHGYLAFICTCNYFHACTCI